MRNGRLLDGKARNNVCRGGEKVCDGVFVEDGTKKLERCDLEFVFR